MVYHMKTTCINKDKPDIIIYPKKNVDQPLFEKNKQDIIADAENKKEFNDIKNQHKIINNQLIDIIIDKNKTIEELKENKQYINQNIMYYDSLILNDIVITPFSLKNGTLNSKKNIIAPFQA